MLQLCEEGRRVEAGLFCCPEYSSALATEAGRFAGDEIVESGKPEPGALVIERRKTTARLLVD
jgi:hypothetical protein